MVLNGPGPIPQTLRIGLLWHSASSGNLGVGALTLANIALAREAAAKLGVTPRFTIVGMRDGEVATYLAPTDAEVFVVDRRSLLSPSGCWTVLGAQDCVLDIGAGDSFAEIYGAKRFFFLWLTKVIAIVRKRPLVLSPQTIGPFTKAPYRWLARMVMERAEAVVARDDASLAVLKRMAPKARAILSVDVAFALPFEDRSRERLGKRLRVGVNASGLLFNEAEAGRDRFGLGYDYAALTRRFIRAVLEREDADVHLITHAVSTTLRYDDDGRVADRLHAEFPATVRATQFESPSAAKSYISSLDFLVSGRMHACIAALSSGVPVVPVAYSRKFSGLFGMLGYPSLIPIGGVSEDDALSYLLDSLERRSELAADATASVTKVGEMLSSYQAELVRLFSRVRQSAG
jgi:polysaccharide pyruvyl transferase WcaK-like protein